MSSYDTCFFERYAHVTLKECLGPEYDDLVNRDRPDLQSSDGLTMGIEVTRAIEESKKAAEELLDNMAGVSEMPCDDMDVEQLLLSGYGYGLNVGRMVSPKENLYWSMALPMKRILESKVSKMISGLYGMYRKTGLYVFSKDALSDSDIIGACNLVLELQRCQALRYDFLYLSEVNVLNVCNLRDDVADTYRVASFPISMEMRRRFFVEALG